MTQIIFIQKNKTHWFDRGEVRGTHKLIALKEQFDIYIFGRVGIQGLMGRGQ